MRILILVMIPIVFFVSCKSSSKENEAGKKIVLLNHQVIISGDVYKSSFGLPVEIDSVVLDETESSLREEIFCEKNQLICNIMRVGNYTIAGKAFSKGIEYEFADSINIQPPSAVISNNWGRFFVLNDTNYFEVSIPGVLSKDIMVQCEQCEVRKAKNTRRWGSFYIVPASKEKIIIVISIRVNNEFRPIGASEYRVIDKNTKVCDIFK